MFTLRAQLRHLAIVTWAVPVRRVRPLIPPQLVPRVVIGDGGRFALVSLAMMCDRTVRDEYEQLNERVYVTQADGSGAGAFFWRSQARSWEASFFRTLLGIPEFNERMTLEVADDTYTFRIDKEADPVAVLRLAGTPAAPAPRYSGIDLRRAERISSNPLIGYTLDRRGTLYATRVSHQAIEPRQVEVLQVRPGDTIPSLMLDPRQPPLLAVYQRATPFFIDLPPRRVGAWA